MPCCFESADHVQCGKQRVAFPRARLVLPSSAFSLAMYAMGSLEDVSAALNRPVISLSFS